MSTPKRPNFLIIVADDLGYSDTSPFGSEIATPSLARLASEGLRLTNFHTASACSPTRSMLFSGTDNHIAGLGQMTEHMSPSVDYKSHPGYEGYLNFRVAALSEILQDAGYYTCMSGKWHLGLSAETAPRARGFDDSFAFLAGCHNHYNYEPQLDEAKHGLFTPMNGGRFWMRGGEFLDRKADIPEGFYSTDSFTDELLGYLDKSSGDEELSQKPFFAYVPYTAPHWPLQAPRDLIDKYKGRYDEGPHVLREQRLQRLKDLGVIAGDVAAAPMEGFGEKYAWENMSASERAESARKMEVYAAMVESIDINVGRIVERLEESGELDDTFVLVCSDNGAEGALLEALPMMGGSSSVSDIIDRYYDNSLANMGNADSFVWYGAQWACASMAPSRGFKTWITEGGIRCPCIVRYPKAIAGKAGSTTDSFSTVMDILPTLLDLAVIPPVGTVFRDREVVPVRGSSWVPHLRGEVPSFHDEEEEITGWELFGLRAIRQGHWKALYMCAPRGKDRWELYDLANDPGEVHDLADVEVERLEKLIEHWETYYAQTGMFDIEQEFKYVKIQ